MISPSDKMEICNDKIKLARFLNELGIKCPREYETTNADMSGACFPLFIKSRFGTGSTYARKVDSADELNFYLKRTPDPVVQEGPGQVLRDRHPARHQRHRSQPRGYKPSPHIIHVRPPPG